MYIIAHLSSVFHNSLLSVCVSVCTPHIVAMQGLIEHIPREMNAHSYRRMVGHLIFM
jgi:hypothetical protein